MKNWFAIILLSLIVISCGGSGKGGDGGSSGDADSDGDTDADGDMDGDADADASAADSGTANGLSVVITEPEDGSSYLTSATLQFRCSASLPGGGAVAGATYTWNVPSAGMTLFGTNPSSQLPAGTHVVTCTASDPVSGLSGSDQVTVTVGNAAVRITEPSDGARFAESAGSLGQSASITFSAEGLSIAGGGGTYLWSIGTAITGLLGQTVQTAVPVGVQTVTVTYTDSASNTATATIEIEVLTLAAWTTCQSTAEVCNGLDDNCNGQVDEGRIACGVGECRQEVNRCVNGKDNLCTPGAPGTEECNGRDDDCDGFTDEHDGNVSSLCDAANQVCQDGHCRPYQIAASCTSCDGCTQCQEGPINWDLCCEFPGVGQGVICINRDLGDPCPVL